MKTRSAGDGGPRGRRCCFASASRSRRAGSRLDSARRATAPIAGAFHIHTNRSDGPSAPDEIAAAAARAGLKFIVFTDHGDGTRPPDPPVVSLRRAVPRRRRDQHRPAATTSRSTCRRRRIRSRGEPRDVVEDVRRLGGFGDRRASGFAEAGAALARTGTRRSTASSSSTPTRAGACARRRLAAGGSPGRRASSTYPFRPRGNDRPACLTIRRLRSPAGTSLTAAPAVVALAGVDAHAKLALGDVDPGRQPLLAAVPELRGVVPRAVGPRRAPTARCRATPRPTRALVMRAIRGGHLYTAIDARSPRRRRSSSPPPTSAGRAQAGDELPAGGPVTLRVRSNAPRGVHDDRSGTATSCRRAIAAKREFTVPAPADPAVYRVEIRADNGGGPRLWLLSNPIYVRASGAGEHPLVLDRPRPTSKPLFDGRTTRRVAHRNRRDLARRGRRRAAARPAPSCASGTAWRPATPRTSSRRWASTTPDGIAPFDRLDIRRAGRHVRCGSRCSCARRSIAGVAGALAAIGLPRRRPTARITVFFDDMTPVGATQTVRPPRSAVREHPVRRRRDEHPARNLGPHRAALGWAGTVGRGVLAQVLTVRIR